MNDVTIVAHNHPSGDLSISPQDRGSFWTTPFCSWKGAVAAAGGLETRVVSCAWADDFDLPSEFLVVFDGDNGVAYDWSAQASEGYMSLGYLTDHEVLNGGLQHRGFTEMCVRDVTRNGCADATIRTIIQDHPTWDSRKINNVHVSYCCGLRKTGVGTLRLTNSNIYTGATEIVKGALLVDSPSSRSAITVKDGGRLGGMGLVPSVTVEPGGGFTAAPDQAAPRRETCARSRGVDEGHAHADEICSGFPRRGQPSSFPIIIFSVLSVLRIRRGYDILESQFSNRRRRNESASQSERFRQDHVQAQRVEAFRARQPAPGARSVEGRRPRPWSQEDQTGSLSLLQPPNENLRLSARVLRFTCHQGEQSWISPS